MQRFANSAAILFQFNNAIVSFKFAINFCFFLFLLFSSSAGDFVCFRFVYYLCVVVIVCDNTVANSRYFPIIAGT
jgi:hypothetical protein